jgi:hypothetical protein
VSGRGPSPLYSKAYFFESLSVAVWLASGPFERDELLTTTRWPSSAFIHVFLNPMRTTFPSVPPYSIVSPSRSTPSLKRSNPEITFDKVDCKASDAATAKTPEMVSVVKSEERPAMLSTFEKIKSNAMSRMPVLMSLSTVGPALARFAARRMTKLTSSSAERMPRPVVAIPATVYKSINAVAMPVRCCEDA